MKRTIAAGVLLAALAIPQAASSAIVFPRFNELAATLGVATPDVRCDTLEEWKTDGVTAAGRELRGFVRNFGTAQAYAVVSPAVCLGLLWLDHDPADRTTSAINGRRSDYVLGIVTTAVFTLAHEAQHLKGIRDETDADCGALAALPALLPALGVPPRRAARMLAGARILHLTAPAEYQLHAC